MMLKHMLNTFLTIYLWISLGMNFPPVQSQITFPIYSEILQEKKKNHVTDDKE